MADLNYMIVQDIKARRTATPGLSAQQAKMALIAAADAAFRAAFPGVIIDCNTELMRFLNVSGSVVRSVTAGAPGFFSPATAPIPTKTELEGWGPIRLTINPLTPWPIGNYVTVAGGEQMTWNGFQWLVWATPSAYETAVMADTPVAYWKFADVSGQVAVDTLGAHNGTYLNNNVPADVALWTPRTPSPILNGKIVTLTSGLNQSINIPAFPWGVSGEFAAEAWFYAKSGLPGAGTAMVIAVGNAAAATTHLQLMWNSTTNLITAFRQNDQGQSVTRQITATPNTWQHVVVVQSTLSWLLYVNGAVATTTVLGGTFSPPTSIEFGNMMPGPLSPGAGLDEFALYDHVLSAARVSAHYAARL